MGALDSFQEGKTERGVDVFTSVGFGVVAVPEHLFSGAEDVFEPGVSVMRLLVMRCLGAPEERLAVVLFPPLSVPQGFIGSSYPSLDYLRKPSFRTLFLIHIRVIGFD